MDGFIVFRKTSAWRWAVVVLAAVALTGCGASRNGPAAHHGAPAGAPPVPATRALSLEEIATTIGCPPAIQVDAAELRQAACTASTGRYVIVTFVTDKGTRDWLDYAQMYGGTYLVGVRWTVVSSPDLLQRLRGSLGGRIEAPRHGMGTAMSGATVPSARRAH
ncbi:hypothetical protein ACFFV7_31660 [Nonomuraea spiralis]|uniref:Lipoprotein n=1 Tax=Nonomuraea spiralis TaxID=46182 RepID=A0ABV5IPE2_9ACTN|nr:hypothetical protein [Nonomuraea spiralis]GGT00196.1 lipoprotein [Nonomuraea spiralis]